MKGLVLLDVLIGDELGSGSVHAANQEPQPIFLFHEKKIHTIFHSHIVVVVLLLLCLFCCRVVVVVLLFSHINSSFSIIQSGACSNTKPHKES